MSVRDLDVARLREAVARLLVESNYTIPADVLAALREAALREESPLGRATLDQLIRNYEIAAAERMPVCQDSGLAVILLETGQDVHCVCGDPRGHGRRLPAMVGDGRSDAAVEDARR
jgi:fumarate hydratase subunit alpha